MFKLLKLCLVVGALAAVWMLVPVGGRTLDARWRAAGSAEAFASGCWAELKRAADGTPAKPKAAPAPARAAERAAERTRPAEGHTERDRKAVDRILAEHLKN
ncbi:MAG TPA: hypothetical protein VLT47_01120 [Anaeromyxobacteraceae bacterium]|nr:hypothetical protein [Anaeromyxobacteraceae bacterium]